MIDQVCKKKPHHALQCSLNLRELAQEAFTACWKQEELGLAMMSHHGKTENLNQFLELAKKISNILEFCCVFIKDLPWTKTIP